MLRTGVKIITILRKYVNGVKTDETKTNVITDQDYIKKYYDTSECKVREEDADDTTTSAPESTTTAAPSTTTTTTVNSGLCSATANGFVAAGTSQWNISFTTDLSPSAGDIITFASSNFVVIYEATQVSQGNWTVTTDPMPETITDNTSFTIDCSGTVVPSTTTTTTTAAPTTTTTTTAAPTTTTTTTTAAPTTTTTTAAPTTTTTTAAPTTTTTTTTTSTTTSTTAGPHWKPLGLSVLSDTTSSSTITQAEANAFTASSTYNHFNHNYGFMGSGTTPVVGDRIQQMYNGNPAGNPNTGSDNMIRRIWVNNGAGAVVLINNAHYSQSNSGEILHIRYI